MLNMVTLPSAFRVLTMRNNQEKVLYLEEFMVVRECLQ